jgi:hypothetical protein
VSRSESGYSLTDNQPKQAKCGYDKKDIRDDDVFLLLTSQSEPDAHRDKAVRESEKHPFYALFSSVRR